jgi:sugar lactone lactonase YvrE
VVISFKRSSSVAALALAAAAAAAAPAAAQDPEVVAEGLANPRGMTFGPDGQLYVAESGRGGDGACIPGPQGGEQCYGPTGAITRVNVRTGRAREVLGGLPSIAPQGEEPGADATGPNDISFDDDGAAYITIGLGADPAARSRLGRVGRRFAALWRLSPRGRLRRVADLGAFEAARNPDAGQPSAQVDTNPYGVDASRARQILVTDAGGNTLLRVGPRGRVRTQAVFPFGSALAPPFLGLPAGTEIPYQPVPTGVARGSRGVAFVGELTGFPFPLGGANVYRVRGAGTPRVQARNFTTIVDLAFGPRGALYVLQISTNGLAAEDPGPGKVFRIARSGEVAELRGSGALVEPTGIAVSPRGDVYVADQGRSATEGRIVRLAG